MKLTSLLRTLLLSGCILLSITAQPLRADDLVFIHQLALDADY